MRLLATALMLGLPATGFAQEPPLIFMDGPGVTTLEYQLPQTSTWSSVASGLSHAEVIDRLAAEGWLPEAIAPLQQADGYTLFRRAIAPGISKFLVQPEGEQPELLELAPPGLRPDQMIMEMSLDDVWDKVLAASEWACNARLRPASVTASWMVVSLTWDQEVLCEDVSGQ